MAVSFAEASSPVPAICSRRFIAFWASSNFCASTNALSDTVRALVASDPWARLGSLPDDTSVHGPYTLFSSNASASG